MDSLVNPDRPPVYCPGCAHERVTYALDETFRHMGLKGCEVVIVSDIGCSGLFDTFFNTHAFHGLHGRALTYATGLKMARPKLHVVVTMGDGGLGIGGAHLLSTCRRNIDITLLVLNNFNYGMTGGQFSATTPETAQVGSGFLNRLERPMDVCRVAASAGAAWVTRTHAYEKALSEKIAAAMRFDGFSLVDIWGVCPGRYTKRNKLTPKTIAENLVKLPPADGIVTENVRAEYGRSYREIIDETPSAGPPSRIEVHFEPPEKGRQDVLFLGSAGQRIVTAGEILCLSGMSAGLQATQKNDYPITVLRGHSVSELILSEKKIGFTGIQRPSAVAALAPEGIARRSAMFAGLDGRTTVIKAADVQLPPCNARVIEVDFKSWRVKSQDRALASLAILAKMHRVLTPEMLEAGLKFRFKGAVFEKATTLVRQVQDQRIVLV